jgi:uncharacterized membrane protein
MRIASTLGGIAICAAVVLFFARYWGYLDTSAQIAILVVVPLLALAAAEFAAWRERTLYFTGLLALLAFASFVMNLAVVGSIFNIVSTERALLAWGAFALLLAYRYGLRLQLALGLLLSMGYGAAMVTAHFGYRWFDFGQRPELVALLALLVFWAPFAIRHTRQRDFPPVYRLVGAIVFYLCVLSLADWGIPSYMSFDHQNIERFYEFVGLLTSAGAIWLGISRQWNNVVNTSATAFVIFLFTRLYHWWWDWMPKYLFFAVIGALGVGWWSLLDTCVARWGREFRYEARLARHGSSRGSGGKRVCSAACVEESLRFSGIRHYAYEPRDVYVVRHEGRK